MAKKRKKFVPMAPGHRPKDVLHAWQPPPPRPEAVWEVAEKNGTPAGILQEALIGPGRVPLGQDLEEVEEKLKLQDTIMDALQTGQRVALEPSISIPRAAKANSKSLSGKGWLTRLRRTEYVGEAVDFIRDVWRGNKSYMVTFFDPRGGVDHAHAYPSIQQRLEAAKFLAAKGIPAQAPVLPDNLPDGIKAVVLVTHEDEPPC